ncbi:gliding motility-associated C-terminal domain-containing protein [Prevotella stercorea]|uniref:gliding motility-associated C-terminal domain-containing protein n=1 Tax=Leyella stercorea TaxID=363265 RepID=UPI001C2CA6BB|nr:gliding motility-associated C-terminal domain-containing protein [Leyella stercorea]MBU9898749.1 gliding motility-associated C-terminal domain-containing protein [Leyella stercorea]MBU9946756.1 gliding motility-associated C-terminal domain-containing protein [Leyella stercorea]
MRYIRTLLLLVLCTTLQAYADEVPTIDPQATFTTDEGEETGTSYSGSAPLTVVFHANAENVGMYTPHYEWRFTKEGATQPYLVRYEEETEYTFTEAGSHRIVLYATFINGTDTVAYTKDYWQDAQPITIQISESKLEMPNAFSPNGDGINDIYRAKNNYQSIVEFDAYIFNRWGQKIYEWHDPAGGWDGKFNGKDVKQGVYFVLVKAKGADGRKYNIKKDVNLLRGYTESNGVNSTE